MEHCKDFFEQLGLYAIGALSQSEAAQVQRHLDSGCVSCATELAAWEDAVHRLPHGLTPVAPPVELKGRLLKSLEQRPDFMQIAGLFHFDELDWTATPWPGVRFCRLREDRAHSTAATLLRIEPGCTIPDHRHTGAEDCLVLKGKLQDDRGKYHAGDYVFYEAGSVQRDIRATGDEDCILFLINHKGIEFF